MQKSKHADTVKVTITINRNVKDLLDISVPSRKRSYYVNQAVKKALEEDVKRQLIEATKSFRRYRVQEPSLEVLRTLRQKSQHI